MTTTYDDVAEWMQTAKNCFHAGHHRKSSFVALQLTRGLAARMDSSPPEGKQRIALKLRQTVIPGSSIEQLAITERGDQAECTLRLMSQDVEVLLQIVVRPHVNPPDAQRTSLWTVTHGTSESEVDLADPESLDRFYERASYAFIDAGLRAMRLI